MASGLTQYITTQHTKMGKKINKLRTGLTISACATIILLFSGLYCGTVNASQGTETISVSSETAKVLAGLPIQVLLAVVALGSMRYSYNLTNKMDEQQARHNEDKDAHYKIMADIAKKMSDSPCLMERKSIREKFCD